MICKFELGFAKATTLLQVDSNAGSFGFSLHAIYLRASRVQYILFVHRPGNWYGAFCAPGAGKKRGSQSVQSGSRID